MGLSTGYALALKGTSEELIQSGRAQSTYAARQHCLIVCGATVTRSKARWTKGWSVFHEFSCVRQLYCALVSAPFVNESSTGRCNHFTGRLFDGIVDVRMSAVAANILGLVRLLGKFT